MQTGKGVETEQYLDMDNQPEPESAARSQDAETEKPAIRDLLAAAEDFNAAFNTALYELEASRTLAQERAARIEELNASIQSINAALQDAAGEAHRRDEAHARETETLNQSIRELESERERLGQQLSEQQQALEAQTGRRREEAEAHARECEALNDRIARISGDHDSLKVIHDELAAHVAKLEHLNRALQDSSSSEQDVHRKIIGEKEAALTELRAKLEAMKQAPAAPAVDAAVEADLRARLNDLEARLKASESQARRYAERAGTADELEAEVERLKGELQAFREHGATTVAPAQAPDSGPAPSFIDRDRFIAHLNQLLADPGDAATGQALMYVLLDNFIHVRDDIGVLNSEQVVEEISALISSCCDGSDLIARFGDCTFAVLGNDTGTEATQKKAEQLRSTVENHILEVAGRTLVTSTSIGICAVRGSDTGAEQVISRADLACESARLSGGNQVVVNSALSDELCVPGNNTRHAEIVDRVLAEKRIKIYYQPISALKENANTCFEVLTRVIDENSDMILPGEFFTMAANSGKATAVDRHVIESVLKTLAEKPNPDIKLFIKLTRQSVSSPDLPAWIQDTLDACGINPGQLVFEVAERVMDSELKNLSRLSMALNKTGCKIAIEHYRLETKPQHLHHIHPDYLKIDSELVQNISKKGKGLAKVNEIMDLAKLNNLITIAEGVESPACLAILWELGVNLAQGYFISEPTGKANFEIHEIDGEEDKAKDGKAVYTLG